MKPKNRIKPGLQRRIKHTKPKNPDFRSKMGNLNLKIRLYPVFRTIRNTVLSKFTICPTPTCKVLAGRRDVLLDVVPGADLDDHRLGVAQLSGDVHGARERDEDVLPAVPSTAAPLERFAGLLEPDTNRGNFGTLSGCWSREFQKSVRKLSEKCQKTVKLACIRGCLLPSKRILTLIERA